MIKSNKGFTLVELIVVIAILAILAGIAIPAYSGYLEKAEESQDIALMESLETGLNSAAALHGESKPTVTVAIAGGEATFTFAADDDAIAKDFADFVEGTYTAADAGDTVTVDGFKYFTGSEVTYADGQLTGAKTDN